MSPTRPNILLIQSDQHRYDCLCAHGHPLLRTPHLDRLIAEGVDFTYAFTPIAVCVPARNCLAHGQWSCQHGAIANWGTEAPWPARDRSAAAEGLPSFSQVLHDAGYHLAHVGKWQVHPRLGPAAYGFDVEVPASQYGAWRAAQGYLQSEKVDWQGGLDPHVEPKATPLGWGASRVIELLEARAAEGEPWLIQWDTSEPHLPNVLPRPYLSMYDPGAIPPWPSFPDLLHSKPYAQAQQRRSWRVEGWSWAQWAPVVARYLGMVSLLDAQIGRILAALDRLWMAQDTIVIYTTDHGDLCGGHGMVDKHMVMYEDIMHVPLIVRWPGHAVPGTVCNAFVSHAIDLATTLCEVAGAPVPATFQGASLLPLLSGTGGNGREDILAMYHGNQFGLYSERMVRDREYKYVWNATAEDELYDLVRDPGELHNLATDTAYAEKLAHLRCRLVAWMEAIDDPLLNGWTRRQLLEGLSV